MSQGTLGTIEGSEMESSLKPVEGTILADTLILAQRKWIQTLGLQN